MKLAILLLTPLCACAEQDSLSCSSSAGAGCHGLDLSMIQMDVQGRQSDELSSGEGAGRATLSARRKALLGFESYARQLATKVIGHKLNFTTADRAAIQTIIDFIDTLNFTEGHLEDEKEAQLCKKEFEYCDDVLGNISASGSWWEDRENYTRTAHHACRMKEMNDRNDTIGSCAAYDKYRKEQEVPPCIAKGHFGELYIKDSDWKNGNLKKMEECLEATNDWLPKLYQLYIWCLGNRTKETGTNTICNAHQNQFEDSSCLSAVEKDTACSGYESCYKKQNEFCNETCKLVALSVEARKADDETAGIIKCLLVSLNSSVNENKPFDLELCKTPKSPYNGSKWDIDCPPDGITLPVDPPDHPFCNSTGDNLLRPCHVDWLDREYESKVWYKHVDMADCQDCVATHNDTYHVAAAKSKTCVKGYSEFESSWTGCKKAANELFDSLHLNGTEIPTTRAVKDAPDLVCLLEEDKGSWFAIYNDHDSLDLLPENRTWHMVCALIGWGAIP